MDAVKILHGTTKFVVSTGVGAIVKNAVKATTPEDIKKLSKLSVWVGTAVVSSMVAEAATKYTKEKIDSGIKAVKDAQVHVITDVEEN